MSCLRRKALLSTATREREDVVAYQTKFLRRMVSLGFLNPDNTPTDEAKNALPLDLSPPSAEVIEQTVVLFHDETTFQANEDQPTLWAEKGTSVMRPKSRGCGIMVSDFISENHGYLQLTQEEYDEAKQSNPTIRKHARRCARAKLLNMVKERKGIGHLKGS